MGGRRAASIVVAVAACACACGSHTDAPATQGPLTIEIAQSPWNASRLDAAIAKALLTKQLGLAVNVTEIDEISQWSKLASGALHASLEVRPSGHRADIASFVDTGQVGYAGTLGPIGKIGWYIPSYLLTVHPELATWNGFQTKAAADLFATADTNGRGRFVAGDPTWTQYDADILRNLNLDFQVVNMMSEEAELAELDKVYAAGGAILMYLWTPHWALTKYDMTQVALPPYSAACYAKAASHGIDCDYPPDALFKIVWPGLAARSPRAYSFFQSFQYTTADQIALLTAVDAGGQTVDQAAAAWIAANEATWQSWLGGP